MAFSGLHVTCFYPGSINSSGNGAALPSNAQWSQTMATSGTTSAAAPATRPSTMRVRASADSYVAFGSTPDATQTTSTNSSSSRYLLAANTDEDFIVQPGDKLAWIAA